MSEGDPIEEQEDDSDQEERGFVDVTTASSNSLLRLRRAELEQLCLDRQLDCDGTKKDMVSSLLAWRRSFTHSASPLSEVGCNWESVRQTNSSGDETEHESPPNTVVRPLHVRTKGQTGARRETKTQALAQIDDFVPDNPALPPLLLDPRRPKRQSRPEATPVSDDDEELDFGNNTPGNRQHRQNDVEKSSKEEEETSIALDLEKLKLQDKAIAPDSIVKAEKIGSGGFKDVYVVAIARKSANPN